MHVIKKYVFFIVACLVINKAQGMVVTKSSSALYSLKPETLFYPSTVLQELTRWLEQTSKQKPCQVPRPILFNDATHDYTTLFADHVVRNTGCHIVTATYEHLTYLTHLNAMCQRIKDACKEAYEYAETHKKPVIIFLIKSCKQLGF